jgi:hypothetical protein
VRGAGGMEPGRGNPVRDRAPRRSGEHRPRPPAFLLASPEAQAAGASCALETLGLGTIPAGNPAGDRAGAGGGCWKCVSALRSLQVRFK